MRIEYTDVLVVGGGLAGLRTAVARQGAAAGRGAVAGAGQALALGGGAGRHAGEPGATPSRGGGDNEDAALLATPCAARTGLRPFRSSRACSPTWRLRRCASSRPGAPLEPRSAAPTRWSSTASASR